MRNLPSDEYDDKGSPCSLHETQPTTAAAAAGAHKAWGRRPGLLANGALLLAVIGGGGLLAWWALSFHQGNEQLWMVPVGLLLVGTPVVVWLSVFASGICRSQKKMWSTTAAPPPPSLDPEG